MFVDKAKISIKAGDGGNGAVSFHREKFAPMEATADAGEMSSSGRIPT